MYNSCCWFRLYVYLCLSECVFEYVEVKNCWSLGDTQWCRCITWPMRWRGDCCLGDAGRRRVRECVCIRCVCNASFDRDSVSSGQVVTQPAGAPGLMMTHTYTYIHTHIHTHTYTQTSAVQITITPHALSLKSITSYTIHFSMCFLFYFHTLWCLFLFYFDTIWCYIAVAKRDRKSVV